MSIYYFDIIVQGRLIQDEIGVELSCDKVAIDECADALPGLSSETLEKGRDGSIAMLVRDESGRLIHKATLTVSYEYATEIRRPAKEMMIHFH